MHESLFVTKCAPTPSSLSRPVFLDSSITDVVSARRQLVSAKGRVVAGLRATMVVYRCVQIVRKSPGVLRRPDSHLTEVELVTRERDSRGVCRVQCAVAVGEPLMVHNTGGSKGATSGSKCPPPPPKPAMVCFGAPLKDQILAFF